ncbi:MAG TPA: DUF6350 family protein [Jiangellaceae bacterium]
MTEVLARPLLRRDEPRWGSRVPWLAALLAAGWALVAGLAVASLPGLVVWLGNGAEAPVSEPLRIGASVWLAAHRVGLSVDGVTIQLAPGGLAIVIALLIYRAARWSAHVSGVVGGRDSATVVGPAIATYAAGAGLVAGLSGTDRMGAAPQSAVVWSLLLAGCAVGLGVVREAGLARPLLARLAHWQRTAVRATGVAVATLLAVGAGLVAASGVVHADHMGAVAERLDPDLPGVLVLAAITAAIAPNAVVWGAAFALGPGFAVGTGTSVAPGGVELGLVPALPPLGALPADDLGTMGWLVLAGPLLAGVLAGWIIRRRLSTTWEVVLCVGLTICLAAATMAALAVLSGGPAGAGRLSVIGPVPWQVAAATAGLVGGPALIVSLLGRPVPGWPRRSDAG